MQKDQTESLNIQNTIMNAINDTCQLKGQQLIYSLLSKLQNLQIGIDSIKQLSIPLLENNKQEQNPYLIYLFLPKQVQPLTKIQIKKAIFAGLLYPVELLYPDRDLNCVISYSNVPIQIIVCSQLGYPPAIDNLASLSFSSDLYNEDKEHPFYKLYKKYKDNIENQQFQTMCIPRNKKVKLFTQYKFRFDLIANPVDFFDHLCGCHEENSCLVKDLK